MAQVTVNIGGRSFRLACNPGEEEHLTALAHYVDAKIAEMHASFREVGEQRIVVMAALALADELFEARKKAAGHEDTMAEAVAQEALTRAAAQERVSELETALAEAANRVEALVEALSGVEAPEA